MKATVFNFPKSEMLERSKINCCKIVFLSEDIWIRVQCLSKWKGVMNVEKAEGKTVEPSIKYIEEGKKKQN